MVQQRSGRSGIASSNEVDGELVRGVVLVPAAAAVVAAAGAATAVAAAAAAA